jgi:geranylgeranyl transferase type-2 subunit beta
MTYLDDLTQRLALGATRLSEDFRDRHAAWLLAQQRPDGGFAGREGASDLYYTGFALRGLAMLGKLFGEPAERAGKFLQSRQRGQAAVVDLLSLVYGGMLLRMGGVDAFRSADPQWKSAVAASLNSLRRPDGGYAKGPEGAASSTYYSFLVVLCLQSLDIEITEPRRLVDFLKTQQDEEGGFREIRASKRAGTNPTAAAIGLLKILDAVDEQTRQSTADFLAEMQTDEGGLRANTRIPIADLLSSFTGYLTLQDLSAADAINLPAVRRFVRSLDQETGGFHGAEWDPACDVEYTFYGLGCSALLAE